MAVDAFGTEAMPELFVFRSGKDLKESILVIERDALFVIQTMKGDDAYIN